MQLKNLNWLLLKQKQQLAYYKGAVADDGEPRIVEGDLETIMAGLACGEPNTVSWDILRNHADVFVSAPDWVARLGMRVGGAPIKGDTPITTGESGAVPLGLVMALMTMPEYEGLTQRVRIRCVLQRFSVSPTRR